MFASIRARILATSLAIVLLALITNAALNYFVAKSYNDDAIASNLNAVSAGHVDGINDCALPHIQGLARLPIRCGKVFSTARTGIRKAPPISFPRLPRTSDVPLLIRAESITARMSSGMTTTVFASAFHAGSCSSAGNLSCMPLKRGQRANVSVWSNPTGWRLQTPALISRSLWYTASA
jgi:hypothetical protein